MITYQQTCHQPRQRKRLHVNSKFAVVNTLFSEWVIMMSEMEEKKASERPIIDEAASTRPPRHLCPDTNQTVIATCPLFLLQDFAALIKSMTEEDERREMLIKKSREVLKASKNR